MEIGFGVLVLIVIVLYKGRDVINPWLEDQADEVKKGIVENSIPRAKRTKELEKELEEIGDVPNLDELLKKSRGER